MSIDAWKSEVEMFHVCLLLFVIWIASNVPKSLRSLQDEIVDSANSIQIRRIVEIFLIS